MTGATFWAFELLCDVAVRHFRSRKHLQPPCRSLPNRWAVVGRATLLMLLDGLPEVVSKGFG